MVNSSMHLELSKLVMSRTDALEERLVQLISSEGGKDVLSPRIKTHPIHSFNGMSGYNYWADDSLVGQLYLGSLVSGTYVIYKKTFIDNKLEESYDYYDAQGNFFYESQTLDGECIYYDSLNMDPSCPFVNHIYNILYKDYESTTFNNNNTARISFYENLVQSLFNNVSFEISLNQGRFKDQALRDVKAKIFNVEADPMLKWGERQNIFKTVKSDRFRIMYTKRRAHKLQWIGYNTVVFAKDIKMRAELFVKRPISNFLGALYKMTIGNFLWFLNTVKSNIGISIAMAIYGPFTFYFITQPMNPHAMWAVGKMRGTYLDAMEALNGDAPSSTGVAGVNIPNVDTISTKQASVDNSPRTSGNKKLSNWSERMSSFKAMQISYEEGMIFAERIGRIEQFETQFNFPLTAEAAWMEMELYLTSIDKNLKMFKTLDQRYITFLKAEKRRTIELQVYLWEKMGQFFLDHPYIVMDEDGEQKERNYYTGRQFIFFEKMTAKLSKITDKEDALTHKNVRVLAKKYARLKTSGSSVLDSLKKNSKLFQQKNFLSTDEFRKYMRRHWEIIFVQQNKKQEAASFALQAYTWSIKNAMWLMQTMYSVKRSELVDMTYKYNLDNVTKSNIISSDVNNEYLENMFNNLVMEFVSVKKEIVKNLPGDKEANSRIEVIENIKQYLIDRDKLLGAGVFAQGKRINNKI